jgi:amino acid transporter
MTACSRTVFAMSRDARFPAHRPLRRVNPRTHTPIPATILTFVLGVVLMVAPGAALLKLIEASTILPAIIYGFTVVLYLAVRKRLDRKTSGAPSCRSRSARWCGQSPQCFALVSPPAAIVPVLVVVGLLTVGALYFLRMLIFDRQTLETEPGDVSVFKH